MLKTGDADSALALPQRLLGLRIGKMQRKRKRLGQGSLTEHQLDRLGGAEAEPREDLLRLQLQLGLDARADDRGLAHGGNVAPM